MSAWKAGRELSSVRFMLVIRACRRMWSSCASRTSGAALSRSRSGGLWAGIAPVEAGITTIIYVFAERSAGGHARGPFALGAHRSLTGRHRDRNTGGYFSPIAPFPFIPEVVHGRACRLGTQHRNSHRRLDLSRTRGRGSPGVGRYRGLGLLLRGGGEDGGADQDDRVEPLRRAVGLPRALSVEPPRRRRADALGPGRCRGLHHGDPGQDSGARPSFPARSSAPRPR